MIPESYVLYAGESITLQEAYLSCDECGARVQVLVKLGDPHEACEPMYVCKNCMRKHIDSKVIKGLNIKNLQKDLKRGVPAHILWYYQLPIEAEVNVPFAGPVNCMWDKPILVIELSNQRNVEAYNEFIELIADEDLIISIEVLNG